MHRPTAPLALRLFTLLAFATARLFADTVETKNGARIIGKISKIDAGTIEVDTSFAGTVKIKQAEVTSISTDAPVAVRLTSGTRFDGQVTAGASGAIQIAGADGTITTTVDKISATWGAGKVDPLADRHWAYEAAVDIAGKNGNKEQLGTAASVRATLKSTQDTLQLYSAYDREITDKVKAADQFKAGIDYQNNFRGQLSWYTRDEGGFDRIKDIQLYNVAAVGLGFDIFKEPKHILTARAGLSYRYEGYKNPATKDVNSAGLDFGIAHELTLDNSKLVNRLSYVPSFDDFSNYRVNHESFFEIPLAAPSWKLRMGVSNDYNSKPGIGVKKLDTAYFTRLALTWQ